MALSKTGRFLSKAEILGVGAFSSLSKIARTISSTNVGGISMARLYVRGVCVLYFSVFRPQLRTEKLQNKNSLKFRISSPNITLQMLRIYLRF